MIKVLRLMACMLVLVTGVAFAGPVNINMADAETLATELDGIGASRAAAIVEYREANGPFKSVDELLNVKGIGEGVLEKNRENILLSDE